MGGNGPLKVVIVGAVACGPKVACRLRRLLPDAEITVLERGDHISYGACGIPYYVEGLFPEVEMLTETPVGVRRTAAFFEKAKGVRVLTRKEVFSIDRERKVVRVRDLNDGKEDEIPYDRLVLATGASPIKPPVKGIDLKNVFFVRTPEDARKIRDAALNSSSKKAVVVGAGYIGIEMAEALASIGLEVSVVEMFDQIFPQFLDLELALLVEKHVRSKGVRVYTGEKVLEIGGKDSVESVKTEKREIPADLVVVATGVRPNDELARAANLACHPRGGILVNAYCQTNDPDIYAGGDCALNQYVSPITGEYLYIPLGSTANKHGRIIANHIAGLPTPFPGVACTSICKVFDYTAGRTGLTEKNATDMNYDVESVIWAGPDKPHYMGAKPLVIKLTASKRYRKIVGVQIVGPGDVARRIDVVATALSLDATLDKLAYLDLAYAPPYSPPLDPIITAAHVLLNKLNGFAKGLNPLEAKRWMDEKKDLLLLDVRTPQEFSEVRIPDDRVVHIPLGALRERISELPRDRDILAFCKVSMRGYEAQRILNAAGFERVWFIEGGIVAWPFDLETS
ncbi:FAD-dependent oxidoreductase [Thermodesulforhabdus norvegica]|uniref:NADPH-dependent 2,4-dienoyl-CoA reductase, sulfur reductase n=1 Tax=Thermodesulforhabdus norvegica TaxID=39841 RepID=A0A1I4QJM3_9BACT|nr:FAD-dependent oxidoreductase [Thermodesulforhabdus norvegica]SFM40322.1 NADPH-dependent 2,4-dienoyl-CoA reductase, sulfur reductase [Thermodesulforhabdus norvegica]